MSNYLDKTQSIVMRVVTTPMKMRMVFFSACYTLLVAIPMIYAPLAHSAIPICSASEKMISYTAGSNGSVVVTSATPGVVANNYFSCHTGGSVSISANPDAGYTFDHWDVLYGTPGAIPSAPVWSIPGNVDNIGVVARFKKSGVAPNIIEPNIYFLVDDSKYMNSEVLYNNGTGKGDASLDYYNMFLHNRWPGYDLADSSHIGGGRLERCGGYNRLVFNQSKTYKPWDSYSNRFLHLNCNGATAADGDKEATCPKWFPEKKADLAGAGCGTAPGCTALSATMQHVVPKRCSSENSASGCTGLINIHSTNTFAEDDATRFPGGGENGGKCFYPGYVPGKCESFKYFDCKPYASTSYFNSAVCANVSWETLSGQTVTWNPQAYSCWNANADVRSKTCNKSDSLMCFWQDDYKDKNGNPVSNNVFDGSGNPISPYFSSANCLNASLDGPGKECAALGGSFVPSLTDLKYWQNGFYNGADGGTSIPSYLKNFANCGLVGFMGSRPYPNIVLDNDKYYSSYTPWADNGNGEYEGGECDTNGTVKLADPDTNTLSDLDTLTNYANWFTYHRTRLHLVKGALIRAINEMQVGRVAIHTISGKTVIDLTPVSTGRSAIIAAIEGMTVSYTTTYSATENLEKAYEDAIDYFKAPDASSVNLKKQYSDLNNFDTAAACRQNHVIVINASTDDVSLINNIIENAKPSTQTDLCPTLANKVKQSSLNKNAGPLPDFQHVKTSIVNLIPIDDVTRIDGSAPSNAIGLTGKMAEASWNGLGLYQRIFSQGDLVAGELPNLGQALGDTLSKFLGEITSEDQNLAPSQCGSPGKRIAWRELTPRN